MLEINHNWRLHCYFLLRYRSVGHLFVLEVLEFVFGSMCGLGLWGSLFYVIFLSAWRHTWLHDLSLNILNSWSPHCFQIEEILLTFGFLCSRFCGQVKNFLLSVEETTGFLYMGEKGKSYPTLQELVQEGLITLYLDQKAGSYIDLMCSIARFHKTQSSAVSGAQLTNGISQSLTRPNNPSSLHSNGRLRKNSISPSPTLSSTVSRSSVVSPVPGHRPLFLNRILYKRVNWV